MRQRVHARKAAESPPTLLLLRDRQLGAAAAAAEQAATRHAQQEPSKLPRLGRDVDGRPCPHIHVLPRLAEDADAKVDGLEGRLRAVVQEHKLRMG